MILLLRAFIYEKYPYAYIRRNINHIKLFISLNRFININFANHTVAILDF